MTYDCGYFLLLEKKLQSDFSEVNASDIFAYRAHGKSDSVGVLW